jgi:hypothetical protein
MQREDLARIIEQAVRESLTGVNSDSSSQISDQDIQEVESLLMGVCVKFKSAQKAGADSEVIARAIKNVEEADSLLSQYGTMDEALVHDRKLLIGQVQNLTKRISTRIQFSHIPDGSLSVMVANLEAIANKL